MGAIAAPHSSRTTVRSMRPKELVAGAGHGEFGPAKVDDRLPHRAPALRIGHRLSRDCRRALGAQDVTHAVAQRQLTRIQSDVHKAPNIIKIVN